MLPFVGAGYLGYLALATIAAAVLSGCSHDNPTPPAPPSNPPKPNPSGDQVVPTPPRAPDAGIRPRFGQSYPLQCYAHRSEPSRNDDQQIIQGLRRSPLNRFNVPADLTVETVFSGNRNHPHIREQILDAILGSNIQSQPEILAFGEAHPIPGYEGHVPLSSFILLAPFLVQRGYRTLVFEHLPTDFSAVTSLPPAYEYFMQAHYPPGYANSMAQGVFRRLFESGMTLYGCGGTQRDMLALRNARTPREFLEGMFRGAENVRRDALTWLDDPIFTETDGGRAPRYKIFYGGSTHIRHFPTLEAIRPENPFSIGEELMARGYRYHPIHIVQPSYLSYVIDFSNAETRGQTIPAELQALISARGLNSQREIEQLLWYLDVNRLIPPANRVNVVRVSSGNNRMDYIVFPFEG